MIKFVITPARINEVLSPVEYFGLVEGSLSSSYHAMLKFMVDESGAYMPEKQAIEQMKLISMDDFWKIHLPAFSKALADAFISPTNGGA